MKIYQIQYHTGIAGLRLSHCPQPEPAAGQVLVKIQAVSLNYRDLLVSEGAYGSTLKYPLIPVLEKSLKKSIYGGLSVVKKAGIIKLL